MTGTINYINEIICGDWIEKLKLLPADTYHCCITSPPYWGQRNYGVEGQLGLEKTPEEHIEKLIAGFREIRRVLRPDGVVWLNYGDKYAGGGNNRGNNSPLSQKQASNKGATGQVADCYKVKDLPNGNLMGLPWRIALALQADGWWLRSDVVWAKAVSMSDKVSGSTMPESVNGWRWERCRVKVKARQTLPRDEQFNTKPMSISEKWLAQWQDCPGCPKCEPNGGYVLRKGSWRCTRAHEYLFQLTKSASYFCDMEAVKEDSVTPEDTKAGCKFGGVKCDDVEKSKAVEPGHKWEHSQKRNLRDVWLINPQAYPGAHYATFPEAMVEPCIKVSTSQKGVCPKCGSQWARIIDSKQVKRERPNDKTDRHSQGEGVNSCGNTVAGTETTTLGWRATCNCGIEETTPALVLDPFAGSGTVLMVAARLGRNYTGIELSQDYINKHITNRIVQGETGMRPQEIAAGQGALFK